MDSVFKHETRSRVHPLILELGDGERVNQKRKKINTKFSAISGPTETYYIPNEWKLNADFNEHCRYEIAALIG